MERRVECVTSKGQPSKHCRPSERPESQAACQDRECEYNLSSPIEQCSDGIKSTVLYMATNTVSDCVYRNSTFCFVLTH